MRELLKKLYEVSGSHSNRITKMLVFDVAKGVAEGLTLGAILLTLTTICDAIFSGEPILMTDVYLVFAVATTSVAGKIVFGYLADRNKYIASYNLGADNRLYIGDRLKNVHMGYFTSHSLGNMAGGLSTVISELETIGVLIIEQMLVGILQTCIMVIFILADGYPF